MTDFDLVDVLGMSSSDKFVGEVEAFLLLLALRLVSVDAFGFATFAMCANRAGVHSHKEEADRSLKEVL